MPRRFFLATSVLCALAVLLSGQRPPRAPARRIVSGHGQGLLQDARLEQSVRAALRGAPLSFEENVGQAGSAAKFVARGNNFLLALTPEEAALRIHTPHVREKRPAQLDPEGQSWAEALEATAVVRVEFAGGSPSAHLTGLDAQPGTINYFLGNDPSRWRRNVPHYGRVRYEGLYPGIDAVFYGDRRRMEFDFVVAPGADPSAICLRVEGAGSVELTEQGGLVARTPAGNVTLLPPKLYQQLDGSRPEIAGRYVWRARGEIGFEVANYDRGRALILDPLVNVTRGILASPPPPGPLPTTAPTGDSVALSTFLSGSHDDSVQSIAIGSTGMVYVSGWTDSMDFLQPGGAPLPGTPFQSSFQGAFDCSLSPQPEPCGDAFVAEINVSTISAPTLVAVTYLGGSGDDVAWGMALDSTNRPYLVGETDSSNFPISGTPLQSKLDSAQCLNNGVQRPCRHAFFSVLSSDLSTLPYSTYLAGTDNDAGYAVTVNGTGQAFVTGVAGANFLSLANASCGGAYSGAGDVFVAEIDPAVATGVQVYCLYIGGSGTDAGLAIGLDSAGEAVVGGVTFSTNGVNIGFPVMGTPVQGTSLDTTVCGAGGAFTCGDGFVLVVNPAGPTVSYSTFLGGEFADQVNGLAVDANNNVYVTGQTGSPNFPTAGTPPHPTINNNSTDAFVAKFTLGTATLTYSTFLGGSNFDEGEAIAIDGAGDAFVAGTTFSSDFPVTGNTFNPLQAANPTAFDTSFVAVLNAGGTAFLFATYYGGNIDSGNNISQGLGNTIALDSGGRIYLGGRTTSVDLCTINPVPGEEFHSGGGANFDGFLTIINPTNSGAACFSPPLKTLAGGPLTFAFTDTIQGTTNLQQAVLTVFNQGSANLANTVCFASACPGPAPTGYTETDNCASVPSGGGFCQITVSFSPKAVVAARTPENDTLYIQNTSTCPLTTSCTVALTGAELPPATVTLTPTPFTFPGTTVVNTASTAQQFTLTDTSTTSFVNISSVKLGGANANEFTITSDFCTGTQVPANNGTCNIFVAFTPTVSPPGARTATLTVTDNGTTNPVATLNATSVLPPPQSSITTVNLSFPPTAQGQTSSAQSFTITNIAPAGSASLNITQPLAFTVLPVGSNQTDFTASGCAAPVAPGANCTVTVTFTPQAPDTGALTGTLTINSDATNSPQTVKVSGTALTPAQATLSTPSGPINFPPQVVMTTSSTPQFVTLTNGGGAPLTITTIVPATGAAGDFAAPANLNGCGTTLAAGASCIVGVTFTPTAVGTRNSQLQFTDGAANSPQTIAISGTGVIAPTLTPTVTFAGTQPLNTPITLPAALMNGNTVGVNITSITATGDFSVSSTTCGAVLAANTQCTINMTFTPTATGLRSGTLTVMDNFGGSSLSQTSMLSGMGATPAAAVLSPATSAGAPQNFGTQAIGVTSTATPFTLTNTGGSPLNISAIAPTGDFGETDNCLPSVAAGGKCTIMVTFTPSGTGTRNGTILIVDNAAGGQQTIFLTGTGSSNVPGFNLSAPLFFGAELLGATTPAQMVTITNSGGAPLNISGVQASGDFAVSANNCAGMIPIGMNCMISVTFTPTMTGTRNGTLTIMDNAPGNPHSISLSGIGATVSVAPPAGVANSATVTPGDTAEFPLSATGTQGLVVTLNLSCVSSAPNTRCSVSPQTITLGGPAPTPVLVTVLTNCNPSLVYRPTGPPPVLPAPFAALWVGTLVLFVLLRRVMPKPWQTRALPVLLLLLLVVTWAGCANNPPPAIPGAPTTPVGTYNITVTAVTANGMKVNFTPPLQLTLRVI